MAVTVILEGTLVVGALNDDENDEGKKLSIYHPGSDTQYLIRIPEEVVPGVRKDLGESNEELRSRVRNAEKAMATGQPPG